MLCANCHKEIKDSAKFCPHCGIPTANHAVNSNISAKASDTSGASTRYITIAASGDKPETHTILLDGKYPFYVKNGELVHIPINAKMRKLKWIPPLTFPPSLPSEIDIESENDNLFFKVAKKSRFLGIKNYGIDAVLSFDALSGLYKQERTAEVWPKNARKCVGGAEKYCVVYDDKIIVVGNDNVRNEIEYQSLMSVKNSGDTLILYHRDKTNEKYRPLTVPDDVVASINGLIAKAHGAYRCINGEHGASVVIYDDKMLLSSTNQPDKDIIYDSLISVDTSEKSFLMQYWSEGKAIFEAFPITLDKKSMGYINAHKKGGAKANGNRKQCKIYKNEDGYWGIFESNEITIITKNNTHISVDFQSLLSIQQGYSEFILYFWNENESSSKKYKSFHIPDKQIEDINSHIKKERNIKEFLGIFFCESLNRFTILKDNKNGKNYPINGILDYELKTSVRAGDDKTSSALGGAVLGGALGGGLIGALAGASLGRRLASDAKIESISLWITIKKDDGETVVEKSTLFDRKTSTGHIEERITELTMYLDGIINANKRLVTPPSPPDQGTSVESDAKSAIAELREWKLLLDDGIVTEEEFAAKKKQIMNL